MTNGTREVMIGTGVVTAFWIARWHWLHWWGYLAIAGVGCVLFVWHAAWGIVESVQERRGRN